MQVEECLEEQGVIIYHKSEKNHFDLTMHFITSKLIKVK